MDDLIDDLNSAIMFPGLTNAWTMPIKTRIDMLATGIKTPVGIKIAGPNLSVIQDIGKQLEVILKDVEGTASVYSERVAGGRYLNVDIDRAKAARYGLNISDIQQVVATAIGGMNVTKTVEGLERYPVSLRYPQDYRDSPEQLALLPIVKVLVVPQLAVVILPEPLKLVPLIVRAVCRVVAVVAFPLKKLPLLFFLNSLLELSLILLSSFLIFFSLNSLNFFFLKSD